MFNTPQARNFRDLTPAEQLVARGQQSAARGARNAATDARRFAIQRLNEDLHRANETAFEHIVAVEVQEELQRTPFSERAAHGGLREEALIRIRERVRQLSPRVPLVPSTVRARF